MITEKNRLWVCLLVFLFPISLCAQTTITDTVLLGNKTVIIKLPIDHKRKISNYDEGIFVDYLFKDGSIVTLFKGANQRLPLLNGDNGYIPKGKLHNSFRGIKDKKYWREDTRKDIIILYENVSPQFRCLYDNVLNTIKIE